MSVPLFSEFLHKRRKRLRLVTTAVEASVSGRRAKIKKIYTNKKVSDMQKAKQITNKYK